VSGVVTYVSFRPTAACALILSAGCVGRVTPTALDVAQMSVEGDGLFAAIEPALLARGYREIDLAHYDGPRPVVGGCIEKARGNAIYGFDVVRVCDDGAGRVAAVYRMQTHGIDWTEVRTAQ